MSKSGRMFINVTGKPSYVAWRGTLIAELSLARVCQLSTHKLDETTGFDFLVSTPSGLCFFVVITAFSSLHLKVRNIEHIETLECQLEESLSGDIRESELPVFLFLIDADSEHGRYARIDKLDHATVELKRKQGLDRCGLEALLGDLKKEKSTAIWADQPPAKVLSLAKELLGNPSLMQRTDQTMDSIHWAVDGALRQTGDTQMHRDLSYIYFLTLTATSQERLHLPRVDDRRIRRSRMKIGFDHVTNGLTAPVVMTFANGDESGRLFVAELTGRIRVLTQDSKILKSPYLDLSQRLVALDRGVEERGLLGLAFHPDFMNVDKQGGGRFYTYTSEPINRKAKKQFETQLPCIDHQSVIAEWRVSDPSSNTAAKVKRRELIRFDQPYYNHNGGCLVFGPDDDLLYISIGDGGTSGTKQSTEDLNFGTGLGMDANSQNTNTVYGTILRIDPLGNQRDREYGVPTDNPFVNAHGLDEIYAYGLRNPWRMCFDKRKQNSVLIATDGGQHCFEKINIIEPGKNYGWPLVEGMCEFDPYNAFQGKPRKSTGNKLEPPVVVFGHEYGTCIIGGFVYRGKKIRGLRGKYVLADWNDVQGELNGKLNTKVNVSRVRYLSLEHGPEKSQTIHEIAEPTSGFALSFGEDSDGEVYLLTSSTGGPRSKNGSIYKLTLKE